MRETVNLSSGVEGFFDDKDAAKVIRQRTIIPTLEKNGTVVIDFAKVTASTQSFIHALLGEALNRFKEPALKHLEFKNCSPQVKSLIELVVDYSLGGFHSPASIKTPVVKKSEREKATA